MRTLFFHRLKALSLTALLSISPLSSVFAHDPGLSTLTLKLDHDRLEASATFARKEIESLLVTERAAAPSVQSLNELASETLVVEQFGRKLQPIGHVAGFCDGDNITFRLTFATHPAGKLMVRSKLIRRLAPGHRQLLTVTHANERIMERLLSAGVDYAEFEIPRIESAPGSVTSFGGFLVLGVEHILMGYDHLLFLFALLIVARSFLASLKVITCFTVAHSITLGLATFNLVQLPNWIVEPLIAASIIYVGVENVARRGQPCDRTLLTFSFGLIHGLGFASVLRDLGVGASGSSMVMPLLSFNLGVETGQILIVAVVLPLLWKAQERPAFVTRLVPAFSLIVALAGSFWLIQRML